jgi:hypothetical protein
VQFCVVFSKKFVSPKKYKSWFRNVLISTKKLFHLFKRKFYIVLVKLPAQEHGQISATVRPSFIFDGIGSSWEILFNVAVQAAESATHAVASYPAIIFPTVPDGSEHTQIIYTHT